MDTEKPESNQGFLVFDVGQSIAGVGTNANKFFYGFVIARKIDIRFVLDDPKASLFKCRVTGSDELVITEPAWDYNFLKLRDSVAAVAPQAMVDALDDSHEKYYEGTLGPKEERFNAHYALKFPGVSGLNASMIFEKAGADEWCELSIIALKYEDKRVNPDGNKANKHPVSDYYACYTVARADMKSKKKGQHQEAEEISDVAAQLKALGLSGNN